MKGYLVLENGSVYEGDRFGAEKDLLTEVVFSTGMTGYQETITDPSYYGQSMVFTYPLIGNYGINREDNESAHPAVDAIIVKDLARRPSNFRSVQSLEDYAKEQGLPGLMNLDTRKLAKEIRSQGSMKAVLVSRLDKTWIDKLFAQDYDQLLLSRRQLDNSVRHYTAEPGAPKIALIDFGMKNSILDALQKRGAEVTIFPANTTVAEIDAYQPDGVLLSNGPGNPEQYEFSYPMIRTLQERYPLMGICLGHQLFALANGAKTYKMKYGYRGFNHAVWDIDQKAKHFTSQNHGYAVDADSVANTDLEITHREINNQTVEGVRLKNRPAFSVQFHPDACPGPHDSEYVFDNFLDLVKKAEEKTYAQAN
ncbi:carbamoyl phosphate synthase small subunit [Eupransor demetentiae]|uniref:Carbamoyl phosphate synthase small chain n=1 Tax=Eupransor demetentiae TaxID=3109584 RepID=A0ABP0EQV6_9LACO|nr:Carbamoylphosphate synthase small subunit (CarA) [Lactobacillaceae bacterium LMG 33000]